MLDDVESGTVAVSATSQFRDIATKAMIAFLDEAIDGPWRPEAEIDEEGLRRKRGVIWLTNNNGDSLHIDEETAAMLVEVLRLTQLGP